MSYRVTASPRMANWMAQLEPITPPPTQATFRISEAFIVQPPLPRQGLDAQNLAASAGVAGSLPNTFTA